MFNGRELDVIGIDNDSSFYSWLKMTQRRL